MRYEFRIAVTLKDGLLDPQGKAIEEALPAMGWRDVHEVRVGKLIRLTVEAPDEPGARARATEVADRLLANPVIEDVEILDVRALEER